MTSGNIGTICRDARRYTRYSVRAMNRCRSRSHSRSMPAPVYPVRFLIPFTLGARLSVRIKEWWWLWLDKLLPL